jgi:hypothetical protein
MVTNDPDPDAPTGRHDGGELTARIATTDAGTTVCTIYPSHVAADEQTSTWISAEEGSFVTVSNYC